MKLSDYKYTVDYSVIGTKMPGEHKNFDLVDPASKRLYFNYKIGEEIEFLKEYLKNNTFVAYLVAPKMAGKGTYTNALKDIIGEGYFENISAGDVVRKVDEDFAKNGKESKYYKYAVKYYRGMMELDKAFDALVNRTSDKVSVPTELMLTLMKYEIDQLEGKSVFIDGFPRTTDQVSYSLYFRDLINHRDDPDLFLFINIPLEVIDARIRGRRTCPICRNSCNLSLRPTSIVEFNNDTKEFRLICDSQQCKGNHTILEKKEGDEKGIGLIEKRIEDDLDLMEMARNMYGIPKIELYNAIEADKVDQYCDDYEMTKEFEHNVVDGKVVSKGRDFYFDVNGVKYSSFMAEPVVVSMVRQLVKILGGRRLEIRSAA